LSQHLTADAAALKSGHFPKDRRLSNISLNQRRKLPRRHISYFSKASISTLGSIPESEITVKKRMSSIWLHSTLKMIMAVQVIRNINLLPAETIKFDTSLEDRYYSSVIDKKTGMRQWIKIQRWNSYIRVGI
jgi:hypothetical protein